MADNILTMDEVDQKIMEIIQQQSGGASKATGPTDLKTELMKRIVKRNGNGATKN